MARSIRKDYSMKPLLTRIPGAATWALVFLLSLPLASLANDHNKHKHHHDHGSAQNQWNNHGNNQRSNNWGGQGNNHWNNNWNHHQSYYAQNCPAPSVAGLILSLATGFNQAPQGGYYAPAAPVAYYGYESPRSNTVEAAVQLALARAGYYRGPVDGFLGPMSRQAIANYQADHGMRVTGYPGRNLLYSLGL
jgi:hypothetical protein